MIFLTSSVRKSAGIQSVRIATSCWYRMDLHDEIDGLAAKIERQIAENERKLNEYELVTVEEVEAGIPASKQDLDVEELFS